MKDNFKRVEFRPGFGFKVGDEFMASLPRHDLWSRILAALGYVRCREVRYVCVAQTGGTTTAEIS